MEAKILIAACLIMLAASVSARVGCMDNSKHTDTRDGYDYKNYHYVSCTCQCERYRWLERGRCLRCNHYHTDLATRDV